MASLTDEDLMSKLNSFNIPDLKQLLNSQGVPFSSHNKRELVELCFYAIRLGLEIIPTDKQQDKERVAAHIDKLKPSPFVTLPHPSTLGNWDLGNVHLPPITEKCIDDYFSKCKPYLL